MGGSQPIAEDDESPRGGKEGERQREIGEVGHVAIPQNQVVAPSVSVFWCDAFGTNGVVNPSPVTLPAK